MARKKYIVNLSNEEQDVLLEMTRKGEIKARKRISPFSASQNLGFSLAMVLLPAPEGPTRAHTVP